MRSVKTYQEASAVVAVQDIFREVYDRRRDEGRFDDSMIPEPGENCLVRNFFKRQESLPYCQRQQSCMISCSCRTCSPFSHS